MQWETSNSSNFVPTVRTTRNNRSGARVTLFWSLFVITGGSGGTAMAMLQYSSVMTPGEYAAWFGLFSASLSGLLVLIWRMWQHDLLQYDRIEQLKPIEPESAQTIIQPVVSSSDQSIIRYGKFKFTATEWGKLARALEANQGRVTRDGLAVAAVFQNITGNWRDISGEFDRLGWSAYGRLTDDGSAWFSQYGYHQTPLPHPKV